MRSPPCLFTLTAGTLTAFVLVATVFLTADLAAADGMGAPSCTCPEPKDKASPRPKLADLKYKLNERDEIAALESVQLALSEVGDGATYVWHRAHGQLSGVVQPTASFKDPAGNVCRHLIVMLATPRVSRKTEGVACRLANGRWRLD